MRRIVIVSRTHGINYGANLQAYALQRCLEKEGVEARYVDFVVDVKPRGLRCLLSWGYRFVRLFLGYPARAARTKAFGRRHLHFTSPVHTEKDLAEMENEYDVFMAGSDQIWNPRYYEASHGLYLLTFVKEKVRVSYGSSFGVTEVSSAYLETVRRALGKFARLSVREESARGLLERCGLKADLVIDPTFLLPAAEWRRLYGAPPAGGGRPYVCCYVMPGADRLNRYILEQARQLCDASHGRLDVVVVGEKEYKGLFSPFRYVRDAGPLEFLRIVDGAEMVLTSSFHGTCFSVIFHKNFYSILSRENKFNTRIEDLLASARLDARLLYMEDGAAARPAPVDYETAAPLLEGRIAASKGFIKEITFL